MNRQPEHLGRIIEYLHPGATRDGRAVVSETLEGNIELEHWESSVLGPRPSSRQLDKAWVEVLKEDKEEELKREAVRQLYDAFPEAEGDRDLLALEIASAPYDDPRLEAARGIKENLVGSKERVRSSKSTDDIGPISLSG